MKKEQSIREDSDEHAGNVPDLYKLEFTVPTFDCQKVKAEIFATGAGAVGNYCECCFETLGRGQFRPLKGANPAIGEVGYLKVVDEVKVEMVLDRKVLQSAIKALKKAHPYECPSY